MMQPNKLTLITPPDIYENSNTSILLAHLTDDEQDIISQWLGKRNLTKDINIYLYNGEPNITWFLYTLNRSEYKYINIDNVNYVTQSLGGYILGKSGTFYKTEDPKIAEVYSYINTGRVDHIEQFLESIFGEQQTTND